jgi:hypothetical protein
VDERKTNENISQCGRSVFAVGSSGWLGVKILVKNGDGYEKEGLGVEKCLVNPCDGRIIAKRSEQHNLTP